MCHVVQSMYHSLMIKKAHLTSLQLKPNTVKIYYKIIGEAHI
jgi:hypothetical protein